MSEEQQSVLKKVCTDIVSKTGEILTWTWDDRFRGALAMFGMDRTAEITTVLESAFEDKWDSSSIGDAPGALKSLANSLGGIRAGQMLFATDATKDIFLICAWWPWGNGKVISIRIVPIGDSDETSKFESTIKTCFGL